MTWCDITEEGQLMERQSQICFRKRRFWLPFAEWMGSWPSAGMRKTRSDSDETWGDEGRSDREEAKDLRDFFARPFGLSVRGALWPSLVFWIERLFAHGQRMPEGCVMSPEIVAATDFTVPSEDMRLRGVIKHCGPRHTNTPCFLDHSVLRTLRYNICIFLAPYQSFLEKPDSSIYLQIDIKSCIPNPFCSILFIFCPSDILSLKSQVCEFYSWFLSFHWCRLKWELKIEGIG